MVFALAGRRIDAAEAAVPRFPLRNAEAVSRRLRAVFEFHKPEALVCSAACGADLIALAEARPLLIRRRVILPFPRERFPPHFRGGTGPAAGESCMTGQSTK